VIFCPHCNTENSGGAFCTSCGKSLPVVSTESPSIAPAGFQSVVTPPASPQIPTKKAPVLLIAGGVSVTALLGVIAFTVFTGPTILEQAYEECVGDNLFSFGISIDDDGKGMFLDGVGEEDLLGASYSDINCVLDAVNTPSSVSLQMDNTNALMGIQTASWDGLTASWSYHPDRGFDVSLRMD
jgi:hypothetical protein